MNSVTNKWIDQFGGIPDWTSMAVSDYPEAFRIGMQTYRDAFETIASNPEPATFDNTINAMSKIDDTLERVLTTWSVMTNNCSTDEIEQIDSEWAPRLSQFFGELGMDDRWSDRIATIAANQDDLTDEQRRVVDIHYSGLQKSGAYLDAAVRKQLVEISTRLSRLFTQFSQNAMADENKSIVLPDGREIANTRSAIQPILQTDPSEENRRAVWEAFIARGSATNYPIISEILTRRRQRAEILGFENHAQYRMSNTMAKDPQIALDLMTRVWDKALTVANAEIADISAMKAADGLGPTVEPWDHLYYAEKVRKARYDFDENEIRQYFSLEKMVEAMFWIAKKNFNMEFVENTGDVPVFDPKVRTFRVLSASDDGREEIGLFYLDNFARRGKRSGAWMTTYRSQSNYLGHNVLASNNNNFIEAENGPTLLSFDDAITLFHEFGHATHYLSSRIFYPDLGNVPRDFVELPSQLFERWLLTPEVLSTFAVHHETGERIPKDLIDKLVAASTFNKGFDKIEYLSCAIVDLRLHTSGMVDLDPVAFRDAVLEEIGMPHAIKMQHDLPHFSHLFSSDAYSAGYYSYMWADVMVADLWELMNATQRPFAKMSVPMPDGEGYQMVENPVVSQYHVRLLQGGNQVDLAEQYRAVRGTDPDPDALLRSLGFM